MPEYTPGVCNIGKSEIRKRYALAAAGLVIAAISTYAILSSGISKLALLLPFVFLLMGFEGFYQGYFRFCAGFAAKGEYDFTGSGGSKGKVTDPKYHKEDMKKAAQIHLYSIASAIIIMAIIYFAL